MKILIKFPTRSRPDKFFRTFSLYSSYLSGKHEVEFVITMDEDDPSMNNNGTRQFFADRKNVKCCFGKSKTKIEAVNADMESRGFDVLILASDDMLPKVMHYDAIVADSMTRHFPNLDGALHFNDGFRGRVLNSLSIMGKKLYDHFGYIYHPDYISLWCDNEFQAVTEKAGKVVYIDTVVIQHQWTQYTGQDGLHLRNERFSHQDHITFLKRQRYGFPKESVKSLPDVRPAAPVVV